MERPKVKDYYRENATLESYDNYVRELNRYADALEESLAKDGEALTLMNVRLQELQTKLNKRQKAQENLTDDDIKYIKEEEIFKFIEWVGANTKWIGTGHYNHESSTQNVWVKNDEIFGEEFTTRELYKLFKEKKP